MKLLILPGLDDSGPTHWQSLWQNDLGAIRVVQKDWSSPLLQEWLAQLDAYLLRESEPVCLVAHSLGVALAVHAAKLPSISVVKAALLVAPSDVDSELHTPAVVRNFAPMPTEKLPYRSLVVASANDPFVSARRARYFANAWGAAYEELPGLGHINAASGLGDWQDGKSLLNRLISGES